MGKSFSQDELLDLLRETTYSGLLCKQKISRKSGESIKILLKKILRFLDLRETTLFRRETLLLRCETFYSGSLSQLQRLGSRSGLYSSQVDAALESEQ